jgi:2-isopropylmalate synthase
LRASAGEIPCPAASSAMALRTRSPIFGIETQVDATQLTRASRLVSAFTGISVQPNKAIVGRNAFAHESGIHQDGMLKHAGTYEIMSPESVGLSRSKLVLGKHSGHHAFREKLRELNYELGDNALEDAFARFKVLADHKKSDVLDEDIIALVDDELVQAHSRIRLISVDVQCGTRTAWAEVTLEIDGEIKNDNETGDGPVAATFECIKQICGNGLTLELYQVHGVTGGTDAQAEVTVRLRDENGRTYSGRGADTDTVVASVKAYLNAMNKALVMQEKNLTPA